MAKLLVIADDFTGALDTGARLQTKNTLIRIFQEDPAGLFEGLDSRIQVLIVVAQTRHMTPVEAYRAVYAIASAAVQVGIPYIYKKTDSALRGNIGSELLAVLDASGQKALHFVPAFPEMNRYTVDGIHYIDDVPVADSIFAADPFEPVQCSAVEDIVHLQCGVPTQLIPQGQRVAADCEGVIIYDAVVDADLAFIAGEIVKQGSQGIFAGCAGFAKWLAEVLQLDREEDALNKLSPGLLIVCGSINPITVRQMEVAEKTGAPRIRLNARMKLTKEWMSEPGGHQCFDEWLHLLRDEGILIIECGEPLAEEEVEYCEKQYCVKREEMRTKIADNMGSILKQMLDMGAEGTILVTGGDTLLAFMWQIQVQEMADICELFPGVVLSRVQYNGKTIDLVSKSGGFGDENLLVELMRATNHALDKKQCAKLA